MAEPSRWGNFAFSFKNKTFSVILWIIIGTVVYFFAPSMAKGIVSTVTGTPLEIVSTFRDPWLYQFVFAPIPIAIAWKFHNYRSHRNGPESPNNFSGELSDIKASIARIEGRLDSIQRSAVTEPLDDDTGAD